MSKKNLIPMNERTKEERRELGRKGGINSGKSRRRKSDMKKAFDVILSCEVEQKDIKKTLKKLGLPMTNEMALAMAMFDKALKGNVKAFGEIIKLVELHKDQYDIKEQEARTEQIKASTEKIKKDIVGENNTEDKLKQILELIEDGIE